MRPQIRGPIVAVAAAAGVFVSFLLSPVSMQAQMRHTNAAGDVYQHIYAIVPLIGAGTPADPKRPMFTPAQGFRPVLPAAPPAAAAAGVGVGAPGLAAPP